MNSSSKKETVLIIENNEKYGESIQKALKAEGYVSFWVKDGSEGLKAIYDVLPQLVILDMDVPAMDAYEVLTKKFADVMLSKIPVFLLSTQGQPINMRKVPEGSVTDFIVSLETDPADIISRVNRYFGRTSSAPSDKQAPEKDNKSKKILWVEDDKLISSILEKKFTAVGISVVHALNGEEAELQLKEVTPDLIIIDITLPGMDGFEILQRIHMQDRLKNIPTLILSNLSKPSDFEKAKMLGSTKYMVKASSSLDQIVAEVRALIE